MPGPLTSAGIALLCDRHLGVGSDGILLHTRPTGAVPGRWLACGSSTPTGASRRCAATASACSPAISWKRGWSPSRSSPWRPWPVPIRPRVLEDGTVRVDMGRARFRSTNIASGQLRGAGRLVGRRRHSGCRDRGGGARVSVHIRGRGQSTLRRIGGRSGRFRCGRAWARSSSVIRCSPIA